MTADNASTRSSAASMTKAEFKARWESDEDGGGITFDDIADCAQAWGLFLTPRSHPMRRVALAVLGAAGVRNTGSGGCRMTATSHCKFCEHNLDSRCECQVCAWVRAQWGWDRTCASNGRSES